LLRLGLVEHAKAAKKAGHELLFPELKKAGPEEKLGFQFTKKFTNYRKAIEVDGASLYDPTFPLHSLRHNFDHCLQNKRQRDVLPYLLGHAEQGMSNRTYFSKATAKGPLRGWSAEVLAGAIAMVEYDGMGALEAGARTP